MIDLICNSCNTRHESREFIELNMEEGGYCYMNVTCPYCNSKYRFKLSISEFEVINKDDND